MAKTALQKFKEELFDRKPWTKSDMAFFEKALEKFESVEKSQIELAYMAGMFDECNTCEEYYKKYYVV
jgi:hypothetical protein